MKRWKPIPYNQVVVNDPFWNKYTKLVAEEIIPYQWRTLHDEEPEAEPSHCISNFFIAAGKKEGKFEGAVFQDTDLAKWLEAVAYSLSYENNEELEKKADTMIELIGQAQMEDGYINTYWSTVAPEKRWHNLREGHELYTAGHLLEAAVAYYQVTGKRKFLDIMIRFADLICEVFHTEEFSAAVPGHQEIEIGLIRLYEATGVEKYLSMAKDFIDRRGNEPNYLVHEHENPLWMDIFHDNNPFFPEYSQCHKPVREQKTAEGHAVRAVYMYCAMADLAAVYDDEGLLGACKELYQNITKKRMYITGGIGSSGAYERFTTDYDLPNKSNYSESCASIGLALFCRRMAQITREAKYADTMERALYNTVLSGIALDGRHFFYVNPLEVWGPDCMDHTSMAHVKPSRQKWFGVACCPPNIARTLASLSEYIYMQKEDQLYVNLYISGRAVTTIANNRVELCQETKFPFEGKAKFSIQAEKRVRGTIGFRIPDYAKDFTVFVNGKKEEGSKDKGYVSITGVWSEDQITVTFSMPPKFLRANRRVWADVGKVAAVKGPLVYCLEETDHCANLASLFVDTKKPITEEYQENLLGGSLVLTMSGKRLITPDLEEELYGESRVIFEDVKLRAVPYCYWNNRGPGEMTVWMKEWNGSGS